MTTIDFDLKCIRCGESLAGLSLSEYCAKCGLTSGDSLNTSVLEPATAAVNADVACVGCGYNLRTLGLGGICPECATPVHKSLRPSDLHFADGRWLRRVRLGLGLAAVAFAFELFGILVSVAFSLAGMLPFLFRSSPNGGTPVIIRYFDSGTHLAASFGMIVVWGVGLLLVTTREPKRTLDRRDERLRSWARILAILAPVTFLCKVGCIILISWISSSGTSLWQGASASAWPRVLRTTLICSIVPLGMTLQIGALLLGLILRNLSVRDRRRKGLYVALAVTSALYGTAVLASLPVTGVASTGSSLLSKAFLMSPFFSIRSEIARCVVQLTGFAFGLVGLLAALRMRRLISEATKQGRGEG